MQPGARPFDHRHDDPRTLVVDPLEASRAGGGLEEAVRAIELLDVLGRPSVGALVPDLGRRHVQRRRRAPARLGADQEPPCHQVVDGLEGPDLVDGLVEDRVDLLVQKGDRAMAGAREAPRDHSNRLPPSDVDEQEGLDPRLERNGGLLRRLDPPDAHRGVGEAVALHQLGDPALHREEHPGVRPLLADAKHVVDRHAWDLAVAADQYLVAGPDVAADPNDHPGAGPIEGAEHQPRLEVAELAQPLLGALHRPGDRLPVEDVALAEIHRAAHPRRLGRCLALEDHPQDPCRLAFVEVDDQHLARRIVGVPERRPDAHALVAELRVGDLEPRLDGGEIGGRELRSLAELEPSADLLVVEHLVAVDVDPHQHDARREVDDHPQAVALGHHVHLHVREAAGGQQAPHHLAQGPSRDRRPDGQAELAHGEAHPPGLHRDHVTTAEPLRELRPRRGGDGEQEQQRQQQEAVHRGRCTANVA